jgi:hypothetical protein
LNSDAAQRLVIKYNIVGENLHTFPKTPLIALMLIIFIIRKMAEEQAIFTEILPERANSTYCI